jgi:hypothetical protein
MTIPPQEPSAAEKIEVHRQEMIEHDAKIQAAKLELERRMSEDAKLYQSVPEPVNIWHRGRSSPAPTEAIAEAQVEYEWAIYDKCDPNHKRTLYPRKRAISPPNSAFKPKCQEYYSQEQSNFFSLLPCEIRLEVYRRVFGQLSIEIETRSSASRKGPPPSADLQVFLRAGIDDALTGGQWASCVRNGKTPNTWKPHIVPLIQSCRQM